jgi:hypothetical protein
VFAQSAVPSEASLPLRLRCLCLAAVVHFVLILGVCFGEVFTLIAEGATIASHRVAAGSGQLAIAPANEGTSRRFVAIGAALKTYLNLAGIEVGYGLFAPNIPNGYRLSYELHGQDGMMQRGVLSPRSGETDLRLAAFLDQLGQIRSDVVRAVLFNSIADSLFQAQPEVESARLSFEAIKMPSLREFRNGQKPSCELVRSYDFRRRAEEPLDGR